MQSNLDDKQRKRVRGILRRIIIHLASRITTKGLSSTEYVNTVFKPGLEELNIEETLENIAYRDSYSYEDLILIEKVKRKTAVVLLLDVSNSMQREKIVIAILSVGILAQKFKNDFYSVVAFKSEPQIMKPMREITSNEKLIERFLDLEFGGSTDIKTALEVGLEQLSETQAKKKFGIIVTDGWATKGGNPIDVAGLYPKLHVIEVPLGVGGGDKKTCADMAKAGGGRHFNVIDFNDLPRKLLLLLRET
jgi:Mg-chelatase subunit ChlD